MSAHCVTSLIAHSRCKTILIGLGSAFVLVTSRRCPKLHHHVQSLYLIPCWAQAAYKWGDRSRTVGRLLCISLPGPLDEGCKINPIDFSRIRWGKIGAKQVGTIPSTPKMHDLLINPRRSTSKARGDVRLSQVRFGKYLGYVSGHHSGAFLRI